MNANLEKVQKLEQLLARVQRNTARRTTEGDVAPARTSPPAPREVAVQAPLEMPLDMPPTNPLPLRDWAPVQTRRPVEPRGGAQSAEQAPSATTSSNRVGGFGQSSVVETPSVRVTVETLGQPVSSKPVRNASQVHAASTDPSRGGVMPVRDKSARPLRVLRFGEWISATLRLRPRG